MRKYKKVPIKKTKTVKKKVTSKKDSKKQKVVCVACQDTGRNSKGGQCIPCVRNRN